MRFLLRHGFVGAALLAFIFPCASLCFGQTPAYDVVVRPAGLRYEWLKTRHFDIIFERGRRTEAREMGALLEAHWDDTQSLVGVHRSFRMPVVLNGYNDRSNGYVTPVPFKQEIELPSIKGKSLSPRFDSWLEMVGTHELTHAVHAEYGRGPGVVGAVRLFAPDLARAFNLAVPPGITEGIAVYRESLVRPGAGRLHHAYFNMQFYAAAVSGKPWRVAQMMEVPAYSLPVDRYYIGGAHFYRYLRTKQGDHFFQRASTLQYRLPIFGYGINLWYGTRIPPWILGRQFRKEMRLAGAKRLEQLGTITTPGIISEARGLVHRRPQWLDEETLLVYLSGYNLRPGFYEVDLRSGRRKVIGVHRITEDYAYALDAEKAFVLFSRYVQDPLVSIQAVAELFRLNLATGRVERWTKGGRVMAPAYGPAGEVWVLQNDGPFNRWVQRSADGHLEPVSTINRISFVSILSAPDGATVAVLANKEGRQGVFRAVMSGGTLTSLEGWVGFQEASIFDIAWTPDSRYLLFSADVDGVSNLFALDVLEDQVMRLTNAPFGAMEPAISPKGTSLAYVDYQHERYNLVTIGFNPDEANRLSREVWRNDERIGAEELERVEGAGGEAGGDIRSYRPLQHLRPRLVYPTVHYEDVSVRDGDTDLGLGVGLRVEGVDPLEKWAFALEGLYQKERAWGEAQLRYGGSWLQPTLKAYDRPNTVLAREVDEEQQTSRTIRLGREERGISLGIHTPVTFSNDSYQTRVTVSLTGDYRQERLFDDAGRTRLAFRDRFTLNPSLVFAWRLQQNRRDLVPNSGLVLFAVNQWDLTVEGRSRRRALVTLLDAYLPFLVRQNGGVRLRGGLLTQNQGSVFNLEYFMPRGQEHVFLGGGTYLRYGLEMIQPLWFIDNGFFILPLYFKALYAYGFADTVHEFKSLQGRVSSAGVGFGLQLRLFYYLDMELRLGASYLVEDQAWAWVYR